MGDDSWLDLCKVKDKQIREQQRTIEKLEASHKQMVEGAWINKRKLDNYDKLRICVEFYADEWLTWEGSRGQSITHQDIEITEQNRPSGGKLARLTLKEVESDTKR